jgi:hypothetical protein
MFVRQPRIAAACRRAVLGRELVIGNDEMTSRSTNRVAPPQRTSSKRLPRNVLASLSDDKFVYIRAGDEHRFIGIWAVVVDGRAFVRSWNLRPDGWYRTFLENAAGAIRIGTREIRVRTRSIRSERLNAAIDRAYLEKFPTKGWRTYAVGLAEPRRRATTLELLRR